LNKKGYVSPYDYSPKSFRCFKDLFLTVNEKDGSLTLDRESVICRSIKNIGCEGMETLWEIACQTNNTIVQERAGYLLAVLYYL